MAALRLQIPIKDPVSVLRKANIMTMLKYMFNDIEDTQTTLNSIFDGLRDKFKETIYDIKYHKIFIINERPIIYVTSITINNIETPINMGFYKSLGTSRGDSTIKDYWFPTTKLLHIINDVYKLAKPEDNYVLKYDASYKLSKTEDDIIEQDNLLRYGRFINEHIALVCYILYNHNHLLINSEFAQAQLQSCGRTIPYTDFL